MSSRFRHQPFLVAFVDLGWRVPVVDDALSSHDQENYPTTSIDENCIRSDFQADWIYYVDLTQTYLDLKLKKAKDRDYGNYNTKNFF